MTSALVAYRIDMATYFTNLAILIVAGTIFWFSFKFLRDKARAARHAAWERDGLLEPADPRLDDPDLSPEARARILAEQEENDAADLPDPDDRTR